MVVSSSQWRDRLTVLGDVVAASCDPDFVDGNGDLRWEIAKPVTYCGGPYGLTFAETFKPLEFEGPSPMEGLRPTPPSLVWRD